MLHPLDHDPAKIGRGATARSHVEQLEERRMRPRTLWPHCRDDAFERNVLVFERIEGRFYSLDSA